MHCLLIKAKQYRILYSLVPLPPANIERNAIQLVNGNSFKSDKFNSAEDLVNSVIGNWDTFISYVKSKLEDKYDRPFGPDWERAMAKANKEAGWSESQKIVSVAKKH